MRPASRGKGRWHGRARLWWRDYGWVVIFAAALGTWALGYIGYRQYFDVTGEERSFGDTLYRALQLFELHEGNVEPPVPTALEIARLLAPFVVAVAAVSAIVALFREQFRRMRIAWLLRNHTIACGLGTKGTLLAKSFVDHTPDGFWRRLRYGVVAIEKDETAEGIEECRDAGVAVLFGDATDPHILRKAGLDKAQYLIALCGEDGVNAEAVTAAAGRVGGGRTGSKAFAHIVDPKLCALLRERERTAGRRGSFKPEFFNVYETGARAWLEEYPPFGAAGEPPDERAHLVVVGVGQMGASLVVGAVRNWLALHYVTGNGPGPEDGRTRPRITLVDREARRKRERLLAEFPNLEDFCELIAREREVESAEFAEAAFLFDQEGHRDVTSIYICLDDDALSLEAALILHGRLDNLDPGQAQRVQIVLRMREYAGLATLLVRDSDSGDESATRAVEKFGNVHSFRLLDRTCTAEQLLGETPSEIIARAVHAEYLAEQSRRMEESERRGERPQATLSMVEWDLLPEGLKESNRRQADHARVKLREVGYAVTPLAGAEPKRVEFSEDEVEIMAILEHQRWVAERLFEGWSPGNPKDVERKISPFLVPWEQLPNLDDDAQDDDRGAVRALPSFLARAGFQVHRAEEET